MKVKTLMKAGSLTPDIYIIEGPTGARPLPVKSKKS